MLIPAEDKRVRAHLDHGSGRWTGDDPQNQAGALSAPFTSCVRPDSHPTPDYLPPRRSCQDHPER